MCIGETDSSLRKDTAMLFVLGILLMRIMTPAADRQAASDLILSEINRQALVFA